jgi:hypothetical protein
MHKLYFKTYLYSQRKLSITILFASTPTNKLNSIVKCIYIYLIDYTQRRLFQAESVF